MDLFIYGLIGTFLFLIVTWNNRRKAEAKAKRTEFLAENPDWYIDISPFDGSLIGLSKDGLKAMFGKAEAPTQVMITHIAAVEILCNGQSIEGGMLRGSPAPDIDLWVFVKGPTKLTSLRLKFITGDAEYTVTFFNYIGKGMSSDTPLVRQSVEKIEYWFGLLSSRMAALSPSSQA